jgi:hypothetical protein
MLEPMVAVRWVACAVVCSGLLSGCFAADSAEGDDFYMDDDVPAGNCMTGTGCATDGSDGGSGGAGDGACESTLQCAAGLMCVGTFDGDIGAFECRNSCIDDMDEDRWCVDGEACCNAGSVCARGYCTPGDQTSDADTGGVDSSDGETTTTDTAADGTSGMTDETTSSRGTGG